MSHLCKMKTQWKDIRCVKDACETLGYTLNEGGKVRFYYGEADAKVDYTIEFNDASISEKYNAGLQKNEQGFYEFLVDNSIHGRIITDTKSVDARGRPKTGGRTNELIKDLQREYSTNVVRKIARKKGFRMKVASQKTAAGYTRIKLTV